MTSFSAILTAGMVRRHSGQRLLVSPSFSRIIFTGGYDRNTMAHHQPFFASNDIAVPAEH
jgi:hypothetical protein